MKVLLKQDKVLESGENCHFSKIELLPCSVLSINGRKMTDGMSTGLALPVIISHYHAQDIITAINNASHIQHCKIISPHEAYPLPSTIRFSKRKNQYDTSSTTLGTTETGSQAATKTAMAPITSTFASPMRSLLADSTPDDTTFEYIGPPIGYSCLIVQHTTSPVFALSTVYGDIAARRPWLFVNCEQSNCSMCLPCSSVVREHPRPHI